MIAEFKDLKSMRIALVHDWLNGMRGGEKCLEMISQWFPDAPIYTLLYEKEKVSAYLQKKTIITSKVQRFPFSKKSYRYYLPFFPGAIESFDFSDYDLVISTSHCVAKSAITNRDTCHVCYCFTPMRYAWGFYQEYFAQGRLHGLKSLVIKKSLRKLRDWDRDTSNRVDYYCAISRNVADRIKTYYNRDSSIIYPPCDTDYFSYDNPLQNDDFYLIVSALVPYKRVDLAIEAFNETGRKLKIIGAGTDLEHLKKSAANNIEFLGWQPDEVVKEHYQAARALIFPGKEDLGIVPIESQACGTPVIAFKAGGALETIQEDQTGIFFTQQTKESLKQAIGIFERKTFSKEKLRENALKFSKEVFEKKLKNFIIEKYNEFKQKQ